MNNICLIWLQLVYLNVNQHTAKRIWKVLLAILRTFSALLYMYCEGNMATILSRWILIVTFWLAEMLGWLHPGILCNIKYNITFLISFSLCLSVSVCLTATCAPYACVHLALWKSTFCVDVFMLHTYSLIHSCFTYVYKWCTFIFASFLWRFLCFIHKLPLVYLCFIYSTVA